MLAAFLSLKLWESWFQVSAVLGNDNNLIMNRYELYEE